MSSQKTVTLTWNKLQLEMIVYCVGRALPKAPLHLSSQPAVQCCPTCATILMNAKNYCSECGQCIDYSTDVRWAEEVFRKAEV